MRYSLLRLEHLSATAGEGILPGWNEQSAQLGNRFAQQVDERVLDVRVRDATGREHELHGFFQLLEQSKSGR